MDLTTLCLLMRLATTVAGLVEERASSKAMATLLGDRRIEARFDLAGEFFSFVLIDYGSEIDLGVGVAFADLASAEQATGDIRWILDLADDAVLTAAEYLEAQRLEAERFENEIQF
eukprot:g690.t1